MERADQVLSLRDVDRGLAADRGVDHTEQRRRDLRDADATEIRRCREARRVADRAAAERDDPAVAPDPGSRELSPEPRDRPHGFRRLARGEAQRDRVESGELQRAHQTRLVPRGRGRLADHRDAPGPAEVAEMRTDLVEEPSAHQHRVRMVPPDVDAHAAGRDQPGRDRLRGFGGRRVTVDVERDIRIGVCRATLSQR